MRLCTKRRRSKGNRAFSREVAPVRVKNPSNKRLELPSRFNRSGKSSDQPSRNQLNAQKGSSVHPATDNRFSSKYERSAEIAYAMWIHVLGCTRIPLINFPGQDSLRHV